jgi:hypothetical protein
MPDVYAVLTLFILFTAVSALLWQNLNRKRKAKSTTFRNPFTPTPGEVLSPVEFLQRKLDFNTWNYNNPIEHLTTCMDTAHNQVMIHGFYCIQHLQQCNEATLLNLAGCQVGVFIEPEGYQVSLIYSKIRLNELQAGSDRLVFWTTLLEENGDDLNAWIWNRPDDYDPNLQPGFSLHSYCVACQKHHFKPEFSEIAFAFHYTEEEVAACWANTEKETEQIQQ